MFTEYDLIHPSDLQSYSVLSYAPSSDVITRGWQLLKKFSIEINNNMADSDTHNSLIGKLAPSFTLPNYDGEPFTFIPGEKGIPAAIFVYPAARMFLGFMCF